MSVTLHRKNMCRGPAVLAIAAALFGAGVFYSAPAPALTVYCTNCGNWWTQMLEKIEAVNTQINTAKQLQDALKQAMTLPDRMFRDITADLQQVVSVYNNARSIGKEMANIERDFKQQYKGYESYLESIENGNAVMPGRYEQWASTGLDNARIAMESAGLNMSSFAEESDMLDEMLSRSNSATGRMQAIQAGNEIAAQNIQQLQKLRDMMQTQITMQANYIARETERQAVDDASREKFYSVQPGKSGRDMEF